MRGKMQVVLWILLLSLFSVAAVHAGMLDNWHPGDGHVHSGYSSWDISYLLGEVSGPPITIMALDAQRAGLKWIIITDHEEMFRFSSLADYLLFYPISNSAYAADRWNDSASSCYIAQTLTGVKVLHGEELGDVSPDSLPLPNWETYGHYLAYGIRSVVDAGWEECQPMIDNTISQGGFGFIAHPYQNIFVWQDPNYDTTGFKGMEIINAGHEEGTLTGGKWDILLRREIAVRKAFMCPITTHIGIAGSDAHWPWPGGVGNADGLHKGVTYINSDGATLIPERIYSSLIEGKCVASTGPLVVCEINGNGIGEEVSVTAGTSPKLEIAWRSLDSANEHEMSSIVVVIGSKSGVAVLGNKPTCSGHEGSTSFDLPPINEYCYVRLVATDIEGNKAFTNPIWIRPTDTPDDPPIDHSAPVTSLILDPSSPNGDNGWYISSVTFYLSARDTDSGVSYTEYNLDNTGWIQYTGGVTISQDGNHSLQYRSVDKDGNIEQIRYAQIKIDTTPPSTTASFNPASPNGLHGWYVTPVDVTLNAFDATSGVWETQYRLDNSSWSNYTGAFNVNWELLRGMDYKSRDYAGNWEDQKFQELKIDLYRPVITITSPQAITYTHADMIPVNYGVTDSASGVWWDKATIKYKNSCSFSASLLQNEVANGSQIEAFYLGLEPPTVNFWVDTQDWAGWTNRKDVNFTMVATVDSMFFCTNKTRQLNWITVDGIRNSLIDKLTNAKTNLALGKKKTVANIMRAYINEVKKGLTFQQINQQGYAHLVQDAQYVINHL